MNAFALFLLPIVVLSAEERVAACNLHVTIRPHADRIFFGDPLYVEVTILNKGEEPVSGLPPDRLFNTFWFTVSDHERVMSYSCAHDDGGGLMGGQKPIVFEPGKPVKYYCCLLLPVYHRFDHPFWQRYRDGGMVVISGVYPVRSGVALSSCKVTLHARPKSEIASLAYWTERDIKREDYKKGPTPADFYLPVHTANREEMGEFVFHTLLSGELGILVDLSLLFRDVYDSPPEAREAGNRKLVEWLRKEPYLKRTGEFYKFLLPGGGSERVRLEPEVKRQVLARRVRILAASYNMTSTVKAIEDAFGGKEALGDL